MKRMNILIISGISAVILFLILTFVQSRIIKEDMCIVYVPNSDIVRDSQINKSDIEEISVPDYLVKDTDVVTDAEDLYGKYAKDSISKGRIIFNRDIASKEELKIIESESGLEKIAVKIKSAENAIAYQIKPKDRVHLYFTGKSDVVKDVFNRYGIKFDGNASDSSLQTSKIIENIEILGIYDEMGRSFDNSAFNKLDTVVIAVEPAFAEMINNLRSRGTFDITG